MSTHGLNKITLIQLVVFCYFHCFSQKIKLHFEIVTFSSSGGSRGGAQRPHLIFVGPRKIIFDRAIIQGLDDWAPHLSEALDPPKFYHFFHK